MNSKMKGMALALLALGACSIATANNQQSTKASERVIYGDDGRIDIYQETDQNWKDRADSTVALVEATSLITTPTGYTLSGSTLMAFQMVCASEPFAQQITAAFCSGSLIAPDIIMSAGHCARTLADCQNAKYVFNFSYKTQNGDPLTLSPDDVYSCKELIHSEVNATTMSDFSLIRLDRPVVGHKPLTVRQSGQIAVGDPVTVIGHPSGLPTKIDGGANVRDTSETTYFMANLDTYGGNSGSAVFNDNTGLVEGILVRGERDFVYQNGCYVSNRCPADGCRGEDVTRVSEIFKYVDMSELTPVPANPVTPATPAAPVASN